MTDATDLLIFKLRSKKKDEVKKSYDDAARARAAVNRHETGGNISSAAHETTMPEMVSEEQKKRTQEGLMLAQYSTGEEENVEIESDRKKGVIASIFGRKEEKEPEPQLIKVNKVPLGKGSVYDSAHYKEYAADAQSQRRNERRGMTKEESRFAAKDMMCVSHPWRPAYAVCDHCKMAFCYADTVEHQDGYYCIEDADKVFRKDSIGSRVEANVALKMGALLLLVTAALLFYFSYFQVYFILGNLGPNWQYTISNLQYSYALSVLNFVLAIIAVADAIALWAFASKSIEVSELVCSILILAMSYEYVSSSVLYLIAIGVMAGGALISVLISRMVENTLEYAQETQEAKVRWPRMETFG